MDETKNEAFYIGILHAVAGGSLVAGLHEIDALLLIAPPVAILVFLTLVAAALAAAVVAAAMKHSSRLGWMRRLMTASVTLVVTGYVVLLASGWYRFLTDPDMFDNNLESTVFRTSSPRSY